GAFEVADTLNRRRTAAARCDGRAVEADGAGETVVICGLKERLRAAEAEADGENGARRLRHLPQVGNGGGDVLSDGLGAWLHGMRTEVKALGAGSEAGGAAKVVNGDRFDPSGSEALGKVFVGLEEAAHVGQNDDAGAVGRLRASKVGSELGAVL